MARYLGGVQGQRGKATRLGNASSGIVAYAHGWDAGVKIEGGTLGTYGHPDRDSFDVFATGGSNGGSRNWIATVKESDNGLVVMLPGWLVRALHETAPDNDDDETTIVL